jgi:ferrous-iron efflux pump FieF
MQKPAQERLMRGATWAALSLAIVLFVIKTLALVLTGSVAMLGSVIDSGLDILATGFNFFAVRQSMIPPDREHRFGHGKVEPIAGLVQGAFIGGSSVFLLFQSVERFIRTEHVQATGAGIAVTIFALVATAVLVTFQRYVKRKTGSIVIGADELHYRSDLILNGAVLVALVLAGPPLGFIYADPISGVLIALYIGHSAFEVVRGSYDQLMDREFSEEERTRIVDIARQHADVGGVHDLRTRRSGRDAFIQLHLELPADLTLVEAHRIADDVEWNIRNAFPQAEVIIHEDPEGYEDPHSVLDRAS